jgi:hypothetical protein
MTKRRQQRRVYQLTPHGERETLAAFAQLGYTEEDVRLNRAPAWLQAFGEAKSEDDMQSERYVVFQSFTLGGVLLRRGHWLDDAQTDMLRQSVNWQQIRDSYLRVGAPPSGWRPTELMAPAPIVATFPQDEPPAWVVELAERVSPQSFCWGLAAALLTTGKPSATAIDLVPSDLIRHASKEYADLRKPGLGPQRASVEGFNDYLRLLVERLRKAKQAA